MLNTTVLPLNTLCILLIGGLIAPIIRTFNSTEKLEVDTKPASFLNSQLTPLLIPLGRIRATNQGEYFVEGYKAKHCAGSIALLNLQRNAEAAHILPILITGAQFQGYIFKGKIYAKFPQFEYAIERVIHKARALINNNDSAISAFAYAEFGQCQIAQLIISKTQ